MSGGRSALDGVTIVSGGQTGADRAALDFALEYGLPCDGWCPRGRRAEDGAIDERYPLRETPLQRYAQRTERNIRDSDATLVLTIGKRPRGGTALTIRLAREQGRPVLHLAREGEAHPGTAPALRAQASLLADFLREHKVQRLNVAGPRASQEPRVARYVEAVLATALATE